MTLADYIRILRDRAVAFSVTAAVVMAAVVAATLSAVPSYTATARLFFATQGGESVTDLVQGAYLAETQMSSFAEVAESPLVLDAVKARLEISPDEELTVSATVPSGTVILEVAAEASNADEAARIANALATEMATVAATLAPARPDGTDAVKATLLAPAAAPISPSSPRVALNLALGLGLATALGALIAFGREALDTKVRGQRELAAITQSPVLSSVPLISPRGAQAGATSLEERARLAEAIRHLRTNLQYVDVENPPSAITVTSSLPGEGKTTTAVHLAISLAEAGQRTLLVDGDLRRPRVAELMGIDGSVGLTTVLAGRVLLDEAVQESSTPNLEVLAAGRIPPNPSELLSSRPMRSLISDLAMRYDSVIFDSAPLLPVTDAAVLCRLTGAAIVVVGVNSVRGPQLRQALSRLEDLETRILGIVLNKVPARTHGGYGYQYGYGAGSASSETVLQADSSPNSSQVDARTGRTLSRRDARR